MVVVKLIWACSDSETYYNVQLPILDQLFVS